MTYPENVEEVFKRIIDTLQVPREEVVQRYDQVFNSDFIQNDATFKSDQDKHDYAANVIWVKFASRPKTEECVVVPFGTSDIREKKSSKKLYSKIYALIKPKTSTREWKKCPIMCSDRKADLVTKVNFLHGYVTKLGPGKDLFFATEETEFVGGQSYAAKPYDFYIKDVGVKQITQSEVPYNLSKLKPGTKYVDEMDLKMVKAVICRHNQGVREDSSEWGVYTICDGTVKEDVTTSDGKLLQTEMTAWTPSHLMVFENESECYFIGTLYLNEDEEAQMQVINIIPIHAIPIGGD